MTTANISLASLASLPDATTTAYNITLETCTGRYEDFVFQSNTLYCNWTFDEFLCWPPTKAGELAQQKCPATRGIDTSKNAVRRCSSNGKWEAKPGAQLQTHYEGWTNYTNCYLPEVRVLIDKMGEDIEKKMEIAERTRTLEIIGFALSLLALVVSLMIFHRFRSLKNNRTKIHKNLFIAMIIQVLIRLTLYIDQAITRENYKEGVNSNLRYSIDNSPYLCEAAYILLEYARTAMFLWMFIEGLYLHNVVTGSVFQGRFPIILYALLGWGVPVIMTTIWAGFTAYQQSNQKCWFGYNLTFYYWILEGPRLFVILLNFIFLLNIIRVLVVKLRQSHESDVEQARKAVRAAFVLLPLLGITNLLNMTKAPLERSPLEFAVWSYVTHFLTSFQGFFIAMIYCFLNGEVRTAILKSISTYLTFRGYHDWAARRQSFITENPPNPSYIKKSAQSKNEHEVNRLIEENSFIQKSTWIDLIFTQNGINATVTEQQPDVLSSLSRNQLSRDHNDNPSEDSANHLDDIKIWSCSLERATFDNDTTV